MSIEAKKFELVLPSDGNGVSIILCGASRSGKTTMMKYLYKEYFSKCITVMFSMNKHANIYKDMDEKVLISDKFHSELLREMHEINSLCDNKWNFLVLSDDYVDNSIKNDPEITRCMTLYRNCQVNSLWSFQGRTLMSAVGRNNANYILIFRQNTPQEYENVIKEFLSMYLPTGMSMREMVEYVMIATQDHQFFFINALEGKCYLSKLSKSQTGL